MRSGEKGFVLVLVVIFLALGSLLVIPALRLAYTTLNIKQLRTLALEDQYARDGAAEHAMWRLRYGGGTAELTEASQTIDYDIVLNGITTHIVIQLRAEPGLSGAPLAKGGFKVLPGSTVTPTSATPAVPTTFDYTITMQELNPDPTKGEVDEVWDQLPPGFTYVAGSSYFDDGSGPVAIGEPVAAFDGEFNVYTLRWDFAPDIGFEVYGQTKRLTFQADATLTDNQRYCNEVAFRPNDERAGKSAFITVGTPSYNGCAGRQVPLALDASPGIVPPNVTTTVTFTGTWTNLDVGDHGIDQILVVLAPGFVYVANSAAEFGSNMTTDEPAVKILPSGREELTWDTFPVKPVPFDVDEIQTQAFKATTTPTESGSAYAEVFTKLFAACAHGACTLPGDPDNVYSWQVGLTIVPAYDVRSEAEITSGWGNSIPGSGVTLESWNVTTN